jgi:hypothetical protein
MSKRKRSLSSEHQIISFIAKLRNFLDGLDLTPTGDFVTSDEKCSRRGHCGNLNITTLYCDKLKSKFKGKTVSGKNNIHMVKLHDGVYMKTCCLCDGQSCILQRGKHCDGHYILIFSQTDSDEVSHDDYALDVTYKQMLVSYHEVESITTKQKLKNLPDYLLMKITNFENYIDTIEDTFENKKRWNENIRNPPKFIITKHCGGKSKRRRRTLKKKY